MAKPTFFCRDGYIVADRLERFTDQLLIDVGAIDLSRIEEGDALFGGPADGPDRLGYIGGRVVIAAHVHAARAEFGDRE